MNGESIAAIENVLMGWYWPVGTEMDVGSIHLCELSLPVEKLSDIPDIDIADCNTSLVTLLAGLLCKSVTLAVWFEVGRSLAALV